MQIEHIQVTKTARCATHGALHANTRYIWVVLHGYAQLATDFIEPFESLNPDENFVISVEGFSRFYTKGFSGRIGATWMTKEDREHDIQDNIQYLDSVSAHFKLADYTSAKIIVLGFSQGVATATRWVVSTKLTIDAFVMYAGEMAAEYQTKPLHSAFTRIKNILVAGDKDPLLQLFNQEKISDIFEGYFFQSISFDGIHEVNQNSLKDILNCLQ
jgi:predicted esterase